MKCLITNILLLMLSACGYNNKVTQNNLLITSCRDSSLAISITSVKAMDIENIIVELKITNYCTDTLIMMDIYSRPIFYFLDGSIQSSSVQTTLIYPAIDWRESSKDAKEIYIANRCSPLINTYNLTKVPPKNSKTISYNLIDLGYHGFKKNMRYDFSVSFDVSNQLKSYCPYVWTGFTKSSIFSFSIK